ncbi:MAG: type I methionyl aminopeptidase [Desulfobacteraceae bacterium 4572_35.1]|nr:MAG: type I methionyl aminopeptidase [Desulfobacteraceae bacterium 4572_35.1]
MGTMIKTALELDGMRRAAVFNGELMDYLRPHIRAGISTEEINTLAHNYTLQHGHTPACLGYYGFPKSLCTSINNVVCHGIPSAKEVLKKGDIVNVDLTTIVDGFFGDSSETFLIGSVGRRVRKLVAVTARALVMAIEGIKPGMRLSVVGDIIQPFVESHGYSVVRDYAGHGIGTEFHENFSVLHYRNRECEQVILRPGMTFTIEPMINMGKYDVVTDKVDQWTVRTKDKSLSAQFEHTVAVTETGLEVLTLTPSQKKSGQILNVTDMNKY